MRKLLSLAILLSAVFLFSGCGTLKTPAFLGKKTAENITKSFFSRTIVYNLESMDVQIIMKQMESLQKQKLSSEKDQASPDEKTVIKLYRDADLNRDRLVTLQEAKNLQKTYTFDFEDSLGSLE